MDIFTHLMIGATATAPFWATHPLESVAFTFGSVAPDIDALSRQFGKVAYLRAHQTWTHAIPLQLALAVIGSGALYAANLPLFIPSIIALAAGAMLHSLLDWTNTYGVKLFAPFDRRRRYLEWVFFIDAAVIAMTATALATQATMFSATGDTSIVATIVWAVTTALYFATKAMFRARAKRVTPGSISLVPSALWPWRFHGLDVDTDHATTFTIDARSGDISSQRTYDLMNSADLEQLPEYRVMRELSVGFLPVQAGDDRVVFEDLRTRNFNTKFGRLTVNLSGANPTVEAFDV